MATVQSLSMMGTAGDMLPLLWSNATLALQQEVTIHFVVQPHLLETVLGKLQASPRFTMLSEESVAVEQKAYKVTFTPPDGKPPKAERSTVAEETVQVELRHVIWHAGDRHMRHADGQTQFHVWAPTDESYDEKQHQEWQDPSKIAFKKLSYGEFLTKWQAVLSHLDSVLPTSGVLRVTNCYDQEGNCKLIEATLGYTSDLHLRIGTLCMTDDSADKKFYAISEALCPRKLYLSSTHVKDVNPKAKALEGVIAEPQAIFPAEALPPEVATFLEAPTVVVTLSSSHLGTWLQKLLADRHCLFICSVEANPLPEHFHWPKPLNLDAVFSKACLVVHACGVGTAYKAVCSGTPSICVSLTKEQLNNAKRLEYKAVAHHYVLQDLMQDRAIQEAFVKSLNAASYDAQSVCKLRKKVLRERDGLSACVMRMKELLHTQSARPTRFAGSSAGICF